MIGFAALLSPEQRPEFSRAIAASFPTEGQLAWLAMELTSGIGWVRAWKTVDALGGAEAVWAAQMTRLNQLGIPLEAAQYIVDGTSRSRALKEWESARAVGVRLLTPSDEEYPQRLREIYDPPLVLWCRGDVSLLARPGIAVVGTRSPTPYGSGMAEMLSRDLAARGLVIFSGMARGVDTFAHKGALVARGKTVAVWGTGVDVVYPKENKKLAEEILAAGGAIISEFPLGTYPATQNFPIRNRVLSGMSVGVLVVEGSEQSGTRITARCAVEQNRELFAVPGNVTNKQAWAPNTLIKQGAKLTATWEDVWEDMPTAARLELDQIAEKEEAAARILAAETAGPSTPLRSGRDDSSGEAAQETAGPSTPLRSGRDDGSDRSLRNAAPAGMTVLEGGGHVPNESAALRRASVQTGQPPELAMWGVEAAVYGQLRKDESLQLDLLIDALAEQVSSSEIFAALFELELAGKVRQLPGKNYVKTF